MSLLDDLDAAPEPVRRERPQHPAGWEPGIAWDGKAGTITSRPLAEPSPDWDGLLRTWGFDPAMVEIVEPVQVRTWDAAIGDGNVRTMWYYRAGVRQRRAGGPDLDELIAEIKRKRPYKVRTNATNETVHSGAENERNVSSGAVSCGAYFLCINDLQIGKPGTKATIERVKAGIAASRQRVKDLRRLGRTIDSIYLPNLGDMPEATSGHYGTQLFDSELNGRDQVTVCRLLLKEAIDAHLDLAPRLVVPVVPSNHGEKRQNGEVVTSPGDNVDVEIVEQVAFAMSHNPAVYGKVSFVIPRDELTLTIQPVPGGPIIGLAHGHVPPKSGLPMAKLHDWWKNQAFGFQPVGDAQIMLVGHFHQLLIHSNGGRTLIIAPTVDSGSPYFAARYGTESTPGMLSFLVTPRGWQDVAVL